MKALGLTLIVIAVVSFFFGMALGGCATGGTGKGPSMGCLDPLDKDCADPTAYPSIFAQLPPWPFPRLIRPLPEDRR